MEVYYYQLLKNTSKYSGPYSIVYIQKNQVFRDKPLNPYAHYYYYYSNNRIIITLLLYWQFFYYSLLLLCALMLLPITTIMTIMRRSFIPFLP